MAKKAYEDSSYTILVISASNKLKPNDTESEKMVYERAIFMCKEGKVRPVLGVGIRELSTGRKGCTIKLRLSLNKNNKLEIKELDPIYNTHIIHQTNKPTLITHKTLS